MPAADFDDTPTASRPGRIEVTQLDLGGDAVFITDREGTIVDVNDAFVRMTGYSRQEAIGNTPRLLSSGLHDDALYAELWRTITAGEVWEGELVDRRRDGALRTHRVTITPVRDGRGEIVHFVAVERDVAGELSRHTPVGSAGLAHVDTTGRCVYADAPLALLLGTGASDLLGDGLLAALQPDDAQELREVVARTAETARNHRLDVETRRGQLLGIAVGALTVASGLTIGAQLSVEDLSRDVTTDDLLAHQEARLASVLDTLEDAVAVVDSDGIVLATNQAWRRAAATPRGERVAGPARRRAGGHDRGRPSAPGSLPGV